MLEQSGAAVVGGFVDLGGEFGFALAQGAA
jgi:hypothetical protein